jgi:hypothetical protein
MGGAITRGLLVAYSIHERKRQHKRIFAKVDFIVNKYVDYIAQHPEDSNPELFEYLKKMKENE